MIAKILFATFTPSARLPARGSPEAAGLDLFADCPNEPLIIEPGSWAAVPTGIGAIYPHGYYGKIAPRSGLALRRGATILCDTIDRDYRGEIKVVLINHDHGERLLINHHQGIAQIIPVAYLHADPAEIPLDVFQAHQTQRGSGGFGSTGDYPNT